MQCTHINHNTETLVVLLAMCGGFLDQRTSTWIRTQYSPLKHCNSVLGLIGLYHISIFFILCFPGWGPQWLSYLWYLSDGRIRRKSLTWTHILHLGIFKRWGVVCVCSAKTVWQSWLMLVMIIMCPTGFPLSVSLHLSPILPPSAPLGPSQAVWVHVPVGWGCVLWDHAAGWCICLTSVRGFGGHPPSDAATDLCAHLYWYRTQVSRYIQTALIRWPKTWLSEWWCHSEWTCLA